jgi:hypothetical protein
MMRAPLTLPPELVQLVDRSAREFEAILRKELGTFSAMVDVPGWVERYRGEVTLVVLEAYAKGQESTESL